MSRYDAHTVAALHEALDDEYRARAAYTAIIERFGPVRPFVNIVVSEERHAAAIESLLRRAGAPIPADRWAGAVTPPTTLREAYALGVQAEIDNHAMYARLRAMTTHPEVLRLFDNLAAASQDNHLTAFQRHLEHGDTGRAEGMERGGDGHRGGRAYWLVEPMAGHCHGHAGRSDGCGQGHGRHGWRGGA